VLAIVNSCPTVSSLSYIPRHARHLRAAPG
jgi:hypothetical protein